MGLQPGTSERILDRAHRDDLSVSALYTMLQHGTALIRPLGRCDGSHVRCGGEHSPTFTVWH